MANGFPQGSNSDQMDKLVTDSVYGGMILVSQVGKTFFQDLKPFQFNSKFDIVAGAGTASETTAGGIYTARTLKSIGNKTITQRVFKNSFGVSQAESQFDNYLNITKMAMAMGNAYAYMRDDVKAEVFKNSFNAAAADGVTINGTANALFGNTQTIGDTGLTSMDTEVSGDLSETTLDAAFELTASQPSHDNLALSRQPRYLLHSRFSRSSAIKLVDSPNSPEDANTAVNHFRQDNLVRIEWERMALPTGNLNDSSNDTRTELKDNWFLLYDKPFLDLFALEAIAPKVHVEAFDQKTGARTWYFDAVLAAGATSTLMGVGSQG